MTPSPAATATTRSSAAMVTTSSTAAAAATRRSSAAGDDTFVWNPGDGSDVVDGQDGFDTLQFNDANIAETVNISAKGTRASLTRDIGGVTMDLGTMERIQIAALGGADNFVVNDLSNDRRAASRHRSVGDPRQRRW